MAKSRKERIMIKIIRKSRLPKTYKTLFTVECNKCKCEFEFENEDFTKKEKSIDGNCYINCPSCGYEIVGKYEYFNPRLIEVKKKGKKE